MKKTTKKNSSKSQLTPKNKRSANDAFEEFDYFGLEIPIIDEAEENSQPKQENLTFKFVETASKTKVDLVKNSDLPEETEKQYNPFITNKAFSFHSDTILHANEMNVRHWLFKDAQYRYYLGVLKPRDRRSKWFKAEKDNDLDAIQQYYQCNRTVAKQYMNVLSIEDLKMINSKVSTGGK